VSKAEHSGTRQIVLFDGVCNLCNGFVNFIIRHDRNAHFRFAPIQADSAKRLIAEFQIDPQKADSVIYVRHDKAYLHSTAALYILKDMGFPWNFASVLFIFPKFMLDPFYKIISKVRYKIFGKRESCMVPAKEVLERFLSSGQDERETTDQDGR
jgi:predicted DCC family thiol-disulfide oxidoreductase YuxK